MATYAIGDLHGCLSAFDRLLDRIGFDPGRDRLLLTGDLVGRGPDPVGVLRRVRDLEACVSVVLGNHDLRLLAVMEGLAEPRSGDRYEPVLADPDKRFWGRWLAGQPLLVLEAGWLLVHAGLLPDWDLATAVAWAGRLSQRIEADSVHQLLSRYGRRENPAWGDLTLDEDRSDLALAAFTRLRCLDRSGRPQFWFKAAPEAAPDGLVPWFAHPSSGWNGCRVLFGHWVSAGFGRRGEHFGLDAGAYLGRPLQALRLEDGAVL